jgi:hypothetical protein
VRVLKDGWTAITSDRSLSAHFEHTVAVTPDGVDVLSLVSRRDTPAAVTGIRGAGAGIRQSPVPNPR